MDCFVTVDHGRRNSAGESHCNFVFKTPPARLAAAGRAGLGDGTDKDDLSHDLPRSPDSAAFTDFQHNVEKHKPDVTADGIGSPLAATENVCLPQDQEDRDERDELPSDLAPEKLAVIVDSVFQDLRGLRP